QPDAKKLPLPFLPQLISGAPSTTEAASVLPDDSDVLVSLSIDLNQTFEAMRKQAEIKLKQETLARSQTNQSNSLEPTAGREAPADVFTEFEKKAGFKIKDELLPALGNEIAFGGSFKSLQMLGVGVPTPPTPKPSPEAEEEKQAQKGKE